MGYSADHNSFWPDDDENTIYLASSSCPTLFDLIEIVRNRWGDWVDFDSLNITSENIHTDCLGYDLHHSSDDTNLIVITRNA